MKKSKLAAVMAAVFGLVFLTMPLSVTSSQTLEDRFNMSYLFFGSPTSYVGQVDKTQNSLDVVSPNYFDILEDGTLNITWKLQSSFIDTMHRRGIRVVPFLSNHWNYKAGTQALANREALAAKIAEAVDAYHLDGVNVDIEGIGHEYRDAFTDLIRLLRSHLPSGKEVSVAVAANPNGWNLGWHGLYDYESLHPHTDYLMLMTYDESWEGSDPGPVSSLSFFERSIQYAINKGVPKEKIVAGLPFYGRIWKTDGPTLDGQEIIGLGVSNVRVQPLVQQFGGTVAFDETAQSAHVTLTVPTGAQFYLANTKLSAGHYLIWYDNERAIKSKLSILGKYGIRGTGSWSLYQEEPAMWSYYTNWLNGRFFSDVPVEHWAGESVLAVSAKGWMNGVSGTLFAPQQPLTRSQAAVILVRALRLDHLTPSARTFTDTQGHWAQDLIEVAREHGLINGVGAQRFAPNDPMTREQLATLLNNVFHFTPGDVAQSPFTDVDPNRWSYPNIVAMQQRGIITGIGHDLFAPTARSTRSQVAALMYRLAADIEAAAEQRR
ncbi:glycosyl hydrolase family 18 protein [Tumebacillus sp. DT12]|uniref:Glycosyl hydrolase family 18 protein n=1 Tax=Tumebacillus lacus TaxID=2995335 RepID=A0ABT3WW05_9BACL|nr:glycosyl hydrolase family 18 protein [Tumebacillus lacus]MCX7568786.1 glycosyl hydrolase family 18 protein [Tumebacillus lacus]